ncbi:2-phospho-L-lactate transferase [Microbulbifer sp. SA54]|uniref:2-phospho-L-lactate transferase n=1 Tax=Microbulbifer sp. SA54 TaxID=3401577 RepID=UPI003AAC80F0
MSGFSNKVLALSGGVGGAKLALGLQHCLAEGQLTVVANTGDDFEHLGLNICPDIDTLLYTLSGIGDQERGWGLAGETWQCLGALEALGGDTWFQLGDRDLATHLLRTQLAAAGKNLTDITAWIARRLGIATRILPMSNDPVRTLVHSEIGVLAFQEYFVRERCRPAVSGIEFAGIESAVLNPQAQAELQDSALDAVVVCPSNPFLSVDPILALPGFRDALVRTPAPVVAVSPIVAGSAIKGPTAKMMAELQMPVTCNAVADYYRGFVDGFVIDERDVAQARDIEAMGLRVLVTNTLMRSLDERITLARDVLQFAQSLH